MFKKITLITCLSLFLSVQGYSEIKIVQKKDSAKKVNVVKAQPKIITLAQPMVIAESNVNQSLVFPKGVFEGNLGVEYRNFSAGAVGLNFDAKGQYGYFDQWNFTAEMSSFPQSENGFEFGGIALGFLYQALLQDEETPEVAVGVRAALFGKGILSLTKDNGFVLLPEVQVKKRILDNLSLDGGIVAGIGNKSSGVASINTTATLQTTSDIDFKLRMDLQNLGFDLSEVLALSPALEYHLKKNIDIQAGVHIGLMGAEILGNNMFLGLTTRL